MAAFLEGFILDAVREGNSGRIPEVCGWQETGHKP